MSEVPSVMTEPVELNTRQSLPCPNCKKLVDPRSPARAGLFCSKRCQQIDLGRWLNGSYAIPVSGDEAETASFEDDEES